MFFGSSILAYGLYLKNKIVKNIALIIFISIVVLSVPVFLIGETKEMLRYIETVGIYEDMIGFHEEIAGKTIWLMLLLGVFALLSLYAIKSRFPLEKTLTTITLVISLVTLGVFIKLGCLGIEVKKPKIENIEVQEIRNEEVRVLLV